MKKKTIALLSILVVLAALLTVFIISRQSKNPVEEAAETGAVDEQASAEADSEAPDTAINSSLQNEPEAPGTIELSPGEVPAGTPDPGELSASGTPVGPPDPGALMANETPVGSPDPGELSANGTPDPLATAELAPDSEPETTDIADLSPDDSGDQTPDDDDSANTPSPEEPADGDSEARISDLLAEVYGLQATYSGSLNGLVGSAIAEYKALPADERTDEAMWDIGARYIGLAGGLEGECDARMGELVAQIENELIASGGDLSLVSDIWSAYAGEKESMRAGLLSMLDG